MPVYKNASKIVYFESITTAGAANTTTTPTVYLSKDGAASAAATNTAAHVTNGLWQITLTATEMSADVLGVTWAATGCVPGGLTLFTEADYTATVAGRIDAAISSRSTYAGGAVASVTAAVTVGTNNDKTGYTLSAAGVQAVWDALTSALTTVGSIGKRLADNVDAAVSSRSSHAAADVWAATTRTLSSFGTLAADVWASATRTLTAGTNIVLAKGTGITGFNDIAAADVLDLANGIETGLTLRQAMRLLAAAEAGKLSGAATTTITIRNAVADTKARITATVDADGNRSAITWDVT